MFRIKFPKKKLSGGISLCSGSFTDAGFLGKSHNTLIDAPSTLSEQRQPCTPSAFPRTTLVLSRIVLVLPHRALVLSRIYIGTQTECENDVNVRCRRISEARRTAFGCVTNIRQTAKCYLSTIGTSKGIRVQYIYVGSISCLGKCRTIYKFTHMNVHIVFTCRIRFRIPM